MKSSYVTRLLPHAAAFCFFGSTFAATLPVTNTADSGAGSLRQAIMDSNASVGVFDTITFNIPGDGVHTISPDAALPTITDPVMIDGYTQPGSKTNTLSSDDDAVLLIEVNGASTFVSHGFNINAGGSTVRGLVINRFGSSAIYMSAKGGNTITGCFVGTDPAGKVALPNAEGIVVQGGEGNIIGGSDVAQRNIVSGNTGPAGVHLFSPSNLVRGNFIGTDRSGKIALGNTGAGVNVGGSFATNNTIGGITAGAGNVISGNSSQGIVTFTNGVINLLVQGNLIGVDATGKTPLGNATHGVHLGGVFDSSQPAVIGGGAAGAGNIIGANGARGIFIIQTGAVVQGNHIGTDLSGTINLGNEVAGVEIQLIAESLIGGKEPGEGNTIAFNGIGTPTNFNGGVMAFSESHNSILGNSIYSNLGLGIDLGEDGVTPNDEGDGDLGPNNLQNFPVITSVINAGGSLKLAGTLDSLPNADYYLEFFANETADPSQFGEGQIFLGSADVSTDANGSASFDVAFPFSAGPSKPTDIFIAPRVTATATDSDGNTSEFSLAVGPAPKLLNISTRMQVLTDDNVLIGGFIITGVTPKKVILRAIGPSLSSFGVPGALADPTLELHESDGSVVSNDNWRDSQEQEIIDTMLSPGDDLESAIVATLVPGAYTAIVRGQDGGTGVGLVEAYDLDQGGVSELANISTRGFIDTGDNVMIGGFIIGPADLGDATVLVRAIGPSLGNSVAGALEDPTLELYDGDGVLLTSNDDWKETQEAEIEATGLPPIDDRESAILQTLAPGSYTAIVRGKNATTGVGLVEAYKLL